MEWGGVAHEEHSPQNIMGGWYTTPFDCLDLAMRLLLWIGLRFIAALLSRNKCYGQLWSLLLLLQLPAWLEAVNNGISRGLSSPSSYDVWCYLTRQCKMKFDIFGNQNWTIVDLSLKPSACATVIKTCVFGFKMMFMNGTHLTEGWTRYWRKFIKFTSVIELSMMDAQQTSRYS